jgi:hypothetical protein
MVSFPDPLRAEWSGFPDVLIAVTDESRVKTDRDYLAAKSGDANAALRLVERFVNDGYINCVRTLVGESDNVCLTAVHAEESTGRNQIAQALAATLAERLSLEVDDEQVQINIVNHTGASGFVRLARQALFGGEVKTGQSYLMVDDFVGQGGTLANFRGYLVANGAKVVGATVLTGKPHSAKIALTKERYEDLLKKHGDELESWWQTEFSFGWSCLTESEARYLCNSPDADAIRNQIAAAR